MPSCWCYGIRSAQQSRLPACSGQPTLVYQNDQYHLFWRFLSEKYAYGSPVFFFHHSLRPVSAKSCLAGQGDSRSEKEDKIHTRSRDQPVTVISTGPVVTHRHGVEPLSDTVCVPDESGQQIKCSGVEEPTRIKCQSAEERVLAIQPDALTVVNDTMVRCPQTDDTDNNSDNAELVITGVSTSDPIVMSSKSLCARNLYDLAVIAIKQEPVSSETDRSLDIAHSPKNPERRHVPGVTRGSRASINLSATAGKAAPQRRAGAIPSPSAPDACRTSRAP